MPSATPPKAQRLAMHEHSTTICGFSYFYRMCFSQNYKVGNLRITPGCRTSVSQLREKPLLHLLKHIGWRQPSLHEHSSTSQGFDHFFVCACGDISKKVISEETLGAKHLFLKWSKGKPTGTPPKAQRLKPTCHPRTHQYIFWLSLLFSQCLWQSFKIENFIVAPRCRTSVSQLMEKHLLHLKHSSWSQLFLHELSSISFGFKYVFVCFLVEFLSDSFQNYAWVQNIRFSAKGKTYPTSPRA